MLQHTMNFKWNAHDNTASSHPWLTHFNFIQHNCVILCGLFCYSPQLIFDIAKATGVEVRAKHNDYVKKKEYGDHKGLSCFSPVINIMRHPLWGRNQVLLDHRWLKFLIDTYFGTYLSAEILLFKPEQVVE